MCNLAFAYLQRGADRAALRNVLEHPHGMGKGIGAVERTACHMAPEKSAIGPAHDAFVTVGAGGLHHGQAELANVGEFVERGVQPGQGMAHEIGLRIPEHLRKGLVADLDRPVTRNAQAHRRPVEGQFQRVLQFGGGIHGG